MQEYRGDDGKMRCQPPLLSIKPSRTMSTAILRLLGGALGCALRM